MKLSQKTALGHKEIRRSEIQHLQTASDSFLNSTFSPVQRERCYDISDVCILNEDKNSFYGL